MGEGKRTFTKKGVYDREYLIAMPEELYGMNNIYNQKVTGLFSFLIYDLQVADI